MKTLAATTLAFMLVTAGLALDFSVNMSNTSLAPTATPAQFSSIY
ncbi:hypothetical protein [Maritalea porphyrae]|nr:hypothetical protein [Maritalea porphyrae]